MTSLSFPDINVWLALVLADHIHRPRALDWWETGDTDSIAFCRATQLGLLRLLTTSAAMNGKPLTMDQAWRAHDRLYADPRVTLLPEPAQMDDALRKLSAGKKASPKLWADAYLSAFALRAGASLVTFDQALAAKTAGSTLLS